MNHFPIYSRIGDLQWNAYMTAANTTADLTSGTSYLVFTADATNGGWISKLVFRPTPAGNTTLTVARIWINNGSTTGTAANNILHDEVDLPVSTASATAATLRVLRELGFALPPGYRIYITLGTASTNGWACSAIGGKY